MGQLCGKEGSGFGAQKSNFETPGRTLASAAPQQGVSKVPEGVRVPASNNTGTSVSAGGAQGGYGTTGTMAAVGTAGGAENEEIRNRAADAAQVCNTAVLGALCASSRGRAQGRGRGKGRGREWSGSILTSKQRRAQPAKPKGTLGKKLEAEKKKTVNDHLMGASSEEVRRREVDGVEEARAYN